MTWEYAGSRKTIVFLRIHVTPDLVIGHLLVAYFPGRPYHQQRFAKQRPWLGIYAGSRKAIVFSKESLRTDLVIHPPSRRLLPQSKSHWRMDGSPDPSRVTARKTKDHGLGIKLASRRDNRLLAKNVATDLVIHPPFRRLLPLGGCITRSGVGHGSQNKDPWLGYAGKAIVFSKITSRRIL